MDPNFVAADLPLVLSISTAQLQLLRCPPSPSPEARPRYRSGPPVSMEGKTTLRLAKDEAPPSREASLAYTCPAPLYGQACSTSHIPTGRGGWSLRSALNSPSLAICGLRSSFLEGSTSLVPKEVGRSLYRWCVSLRPKSPSLATFGGSTSLVPKEVSRSLYRWCVSLRP